MKRLISFIVIVAALFSLCVSAASLDPDKLNIVIDGGLDKKYAAAGEYVEVKISLSGNKGICSLLANVSWSEKLELQSAKYECLDENSEASMASYPANGADWNTVGNSFIFNWVSAKSEYKEDGAVITLVFKVGSNVIKDEFLFVNAEIDGDNLFDTDYNNVEFNLINGGVTVTDEATGTLPSDTNDTEPEPTGTEPESSGAVTTETSGQGGLNTTAIIIIVIAAVVVVAVAVVVIVLAKRKSGK